MFDDDVLAHDLFNNHVDHHQRAHPETRDAPLAEKMHGPAEIAQQELHRKNVEKHPHGAAQTVMRGPVGPLDVLDGNFHDSRAIQTGQRRNKAVQLAIQINVLQHFGAICFEGGAEIVQIHAGNLLDEPIGDPRRDLPRHGIIDPVFAPAARDVETFIDLLEQQWNVVGIVLQIAIQ